MTAGTAQLNLGGSVVRFSAEAPDTLSLPALYTPFLHPPSDPQSVERWRHVDRGDGPTADVHIRLTTEPGPEPRDLIRCFTADGAWSAYTDGRDPYIALQPPQAPSCLWLLHATADYTQGTLHCAKVLAPREDPREDPEESPREGPREGNKASSAHGVCYRHVVQYPLDQLVLMHSLIHREINPGLIVHGAGFKVPGLGSVVLAGPSGAGKTTISGLLEGANRVFQSDDRMVLRCGESHLLAYGTPWPGTGGYMDPAGEPLRALGFLTQGPRPEIRRLSPKTALARLLPVVSIPWYQKQASYLGLGLCQRILEAVPLFELVFNRHQAEVERVVDAFLNDLCAGA